MILSFITVGIFAYFINNAVLTINDEVVRLATDQNASGEKEAISLIRSRLSWILRLSILCVILLIVPGQVFASALTRPLAALALAAKGIAQGDVNQKVGHKSSDEIGMLAEAFRQMVGYLQEMARAARAMAKGDMAAKFQPRPAEDVLGNNFKETAQALQALVKTLSNLKEAAKQGRLSERGDAADEPAYPAERGQLPGVGERRRI